MRVRGVAELHRKLRQFGERGEQRVREITQASGQEIATKAIQNLSSYHDVDTDGQIRQSISSKSEADGLISAIIVQNVPMGAYIEFGTGTFVEVPPGWENIAWQFYVNGQGWMSPRPYLEPAHREGLTEYKRQLQLMIDRLTREFNSR